MTSLDAWIDQWADDNAADDFDITSDLPEVIEPDPVDLYCDRCQGICGCPLDAPPWNLP